MQLQLALVLSALVAIVGCHGQQVVGPVPLPVHHGLKPAGASDRSVYAKAVSSLTNVTSDVYRVFVGPAEMHQPKSAVVIFNTGATADRVKGSVMLTQEQNVAPVRINGTITGLTPGKHGFHVHATGDLRDGCASALGHFNPFKQPHGAPEDKNRHSGDLGNIVAGDDGVANLDFSDSIISLFGPNTILGKAIVIHEKEDDLGRTAHADSRTTGNAGGRLVCGIIGSIA